MSLFDLKQAYKITFTKKVFNLELQTIGTSYKKRIGNTGKLVAQKNYTAWKVSKYGVIAGKYGPEITPYLRTFHAVCETK